MVHCVHIAFLSVGLLKSTVLLLHPHG